MFPSGDSPRAVAPCALHATQPAHSSTWTLAGRAIRDMRRRVSGETTRRLDVYFDIADAWSYLTAQAAARLVEAYPVELGFHVVTPPASDVNPAAGMRPVQAVRDAQLLADYWDL